MFHPISPEMQERMAYLEAIDARDRLDGTPKSRRVRQIPPETGRFLAIMAASAPLGAVIEIGTSAGYSAMWLALACRQRGDRLTTFEFDADKVRLAGETFRLVGVEDVIQVVHGDARAYLGDIQPIAFCFLDCEKETYGEIYELAVPRLVSGGLLAADNVINQRDELQEFIDRTLSDPRLDALIVPIGKGVLLGRKV
jgi:predicted O-methyltransferase YrrM